tara:strand:- start:4149 stop:4316 length:168 start_codon:yes stop_codon:yes gene_type:complete
VKVKAKSKIPPSDSCKGLSEDVWNRLNQGEEVEIDEIPNLAKPYLEILEQKKKGK